MSIDLEKNIGMMTSKYYFSEDWNCETARSGESIPIVTSNGGIGAEIDTAVGDCESSFLAPSIHDTA